MKKAKTVFAALICVVFCAALFHPLSAAAEGGTVVAYTSTFEGVATAASEPAVDPPIPEGGSSGSDILLKWEREGYPENILGVSVSTHGYNPTDPDSVPGQVTYSVFLAKGTDENRKEEIRSLLSDGKVDFTECSLTAAETAEKKAAIERAAGDLVERVETGFSGTDIIFLLLYPGENEDAVRAAMEKAFGENDPYLCYSPYYPVEDGVPETVAAADDHRFVAITAVDRKERPAFPLFALFAGFTVLVVVVAVLFSAARKRGAVKLKNNGEAEEDTLPAKAIEEAIREDKASPSPSVRENVMKEISLK